jgi:hypothetical protein
VPFDVQALVSVDQQKVDILVGKEDFLTMAGVVVEHAFTPSSEDLSVLLFHLIVP